MHDPINHPSWYAATKVECIVAIEAMVESWDGISAALGMNILKYVWRHKQKGGSESLKKAQFYLTRLIKHVEEEDARGAEIK